MDKKTDVLKILVLTSCSGEKKYTPENAALSKDLDDLELRRKKEVELESYKTTAKDLFISTQNLMLWEGFSYLSGNDDIELKIAYISSGYGFLNANDYIVPYDINFSAMSMIDLDKRAEILKLHEEVYYTARNYDIVIYLISYEYLRVLKLPVELPDNIRQIFFVSPSDEKVLPDDKNISVILTGNEVASKLEVNPQELKGYIFRLICQKSKEDVFQKIYKNPNFIKSIIEKKIKSLETKHDQLRLFDF